MSGAEEGKSGIVLDSVEVVGEVALKRCETQGGASLSLALKIVTQGFYFFFFLIKSISNNALLLTPVLKLRLLFSSPSSLEEEVSSSPMLLLYDRSNKGATLQLRLFPFGVSYSQMTAYFGSL